MRRLLRARGLGPLVLTAAVAELGVRLLAPREPPLEPVPLDLEQYFSPQEVERGARFARPQMALGLARSALNLAALAEVVRRSRSSRSRPSRSSRSRPSRSSRSLASRSSRSLAALAEVVRPSRSSRSRPSLPSLAGAAAAAELVGGLTLVSLPLSAVSRRRAIAVGLITQSWRGWAGDVVKSTAIEATLAGGAGAAALALIRRYPRDWWLPAAAGSVAVGTLLGALAPVVLDPVFNDFTPLPDGELRSDVLELAKAAGVEVGEVYEVDASRRTTGANAYVTGLGPTKRVVLFDTLVERFTRDEVRVVVAHELSHVRHRDVIRGVAYSALVAPAAALAVQRLSWAISGQRDTPAALPALGLAAALVAAPVGLIGNRLSRALERRADTYSLKLSDAPDAFVSFERAIALQNVADLKPPRSVTALLATHPSTLERIGAAVAYARREGRAAG